MRIYKEGERSPASTETEVELEEINSFSKTELSQDMVYTFSVVLCDNEVDRDFERFSEKTLEDLSKLFVGCTGIFDHEWKAKNQTARIYRTEIVKEKDIFNSLGQPYVMLKGYAYMLRNEKNAELIESIEAGIIRETSVGCSVKKRVCSICGDEMCSAECGHIPGTEYNGKLCYVELLNAEDAYEFSFVAVPAQRRSGVVKGFDKEKFNNLKSFVQSEKGQQFSSEFEELEKNASFGREMRDNLCKEVLRLSLLCDRKLYDALQFSLKSMGTNELLKLKSVFEERLSKELPLQTQLPGKNQTVSFDGEEYLI